VRVDRSKRVPHEGRGALAAVDRLSGRARVPVLRPHQDARAREGEAEEDAIAGVHYAGERVQARPFARIHGLAVRPVDLVAEPEPGVVAPVRVRPVVGDAHLVPIALGRQPVQEVAGAVAVRVGLGQSGDVVRERAKVLRERGAQLLVVVRGGRALQRRDVRRGRQPHRGGAGCGLTGGEGEAASRMGTLGRGRGARLGDRRKKDEDRDGGYGVGRAPLPCEALALAT